MLFVVVPFMLSAFCFILDGALKRARARRAAQAEAEEARRQAEARRAAIRKQEEAKRQQAAQAARRAAEQAAREERRKAEQAARDAETARRRAEKLEYMRQMVELKEREMEADRAWKENQKTPAKPKPAQQQAPKNAAGPFAGETISFTGKILNFSRQQVIDITERKGGKGRETIRTDCTLLVVGDKPGKNQLEQAKKWNTKIITWEEWHQKAFGFVPRRAA